MIGALQQLEAWCKGGRGARSGRIEHTKQLRDENTRLRKLVADLSLDKEALQSVIRKNAFCAWLRSMPRYFAFQA